jgi:AAA15 family ATPase/GTPase
MRVFLKELEISNWKGIKHESFNFTTRDSYFFGANGTGKTSVFASFIWLLLGVDNFGRADHQIKPLKDGEPEPRLDCEVSASLLVDDHIQLRLKRILHEDWAKPKTKSEEIFKGNTTLFYINEVGVQKKEYDQKVAEICPPHVFKTVTNPHYFTSLTRDEQRKILFSMVDNVTDEQIAAGNPEYEAMLKEIKGVTMAQFKKSLAAQISRIQKDIDDITPRIAELTRNKPEAKDWSQLEASLKENEAALAELDQQLTDKAKRSEAASNNRLAHQVAVNELVNANKQIEFGEQAKRIEQVEEMKSKIRSLTLEIGNRQRDGVTQNARLSYLRIEIEKLTKEKAALLSEYTSINSEQLVFPEGSFDCPTCHRPLDINDIESKQAEMTETFNQSKASRIEGNITKGKALKAQIGTLELEVSNLTEVPLADASDLEKQIEQIKKDKEELEAKPIPVKENKDYIKNEGKISDLKALIDIKDNTPVDQELNAGKQILKDQIQALTIELASREAINNTAKRIKELEDQKKTLNQEKTDLEKKEYVIAQFEDAKSMEYELRINKLFQMVQFRLFKKQVDGQVVPDCECMVDGVLYSTLNNAAQINAGLDIIRAISKHFNLYAPIFIDNRESVTEIPDMACQVINLVVDKSYAKLTYISEYGEINEHMN